MHRPFSPCPATLPAAVLALLLPTLLLAAPPPNSTADIAAVAYEGLHVGMDVMAANTTLEKLGYTWQPQATSRSRTAPTQQAVFSPSVAGQPCAHAYDRKSGGEERTVRFACDLATGRLLSFRRLGPSNPLSIDRR